MAGRIAIIVLAAGESRRLGRAKQLVKLGGASLVRRAVQTALAAASVNPGARSGAALHGVASAAEVLVVLGAHGDAVRNELTGLPVRFVENPDYSQGMGTSIRAAVAAVQAYDSAILMPCDQPQLSPEILLSLMQNRVAHGAAAVACDYGGGVMGPPTLFGRELFDELQAIPPDSGAKVVLQRHRDELRLVSFPGGAIDIDTPADLP